MKKHVRLLFVCSTMVRNGPILVCCFLIFIKNEEGHYEHRLTNKQHPCCGDEIWMMNSKFYPWCWWIWCNYSAFSFLTWMTALNQQVFPTLRMPTGQSSWRIQSAGLHISLWASHLFLFILAAFSSALASRALRLTKLPIWKHQCDASFEHRLARLDIWSCVKAKNEHLYKL